MAHTDHCPQVWFFGAGDTTGDTSDDAGGGPERPACIALQDPERIVLVDGGETTLAGLRGRDLDPVRVGGIVLTALSAEHLEGVLPLIREVRRGRRRPLVLWGPAGLDARLRDIGSSAAPGDGEESGCELRVVELAPSAPPSPCEGTDVDDIEVSAVEVGHPGEASSLAVRITMGGHTVVYSGCTTWTAVLGDAGQDADLYVLTSRSWEARAATASRDADGLAQLGAKKVILTGPAAQMRANAGEAELPVASDGQVVDLD